MLFHNYMEKLLGSKTKIKILRALHRFPSKDFTTRELSRLIEISHTGVLKALKDLEDMGIIVVGTHGKAHSLKLNKESFLAQGILSIFEVEKETVSHLVEELRRYTKDMDVTSIALFGSIVKKNEEPSSDIDLLIVSRDKRNAEKTISLLQERFVKRFGNSISPHIMSLDEFKVGGRFIEDVLDNNVLIVGKKLEDLYADEKG